MISQHESPAEVLSYMVAFAEGWEEPRLARLIEECRLHIWLEPDEELGLIDKYFPELYPRTLASILVPGDLYEQALREESSIGSALCEAISPRDLDQWFLERGEVREWLNQAQPGGAPAAPAIWRGMRFRSKAEMAIAQALERACLDYAPNCLVRHGAALVDRLTREPDFLVFDSGRVGVLEVDGEPWHQPERSAAEHIRDRRFRRKGWAVERFDAGECRTFPDDVVARFLEVLRASRCV